MQLNGEMIEFQA